MLIQEWNNIPQLRIQNIIQSMRRRCQACIQAVSNAYPGMEQYSIVEDSERYSVNAYSLSRVHTGEWWS